MLVAPALLQALTPPATAQPAPAQQAAIRQACAVDFQQRCAGIPPGSMDALACLQRVTDQLSPGCRAAIATLSSASKVPPPRQAASPPPAQAAAATDLDTWPHRIEGPGGSALVYQPQVISWAAGDTLSARIALAVTPIETGVTAWGSVDVWFATRTDLASRTVELSNARVNAIHFPTLAPEPLALVSAKIKSAFDSLGVKRVPLAAVVRSLRDSAERTPEVALNNDAPPIFVSERPASLVVFDGEPVLAPIAGTRLSFAVNTNWDVFVDAESRQWFLLTSGGWMSAPSANGPWVAASASMAAFQSLPDDANFADVRRSLAAPPMKMRDAPTIFVSNVPAQIIVTDGAPQYTPIAGTRLAYLANSDAAVFRDNSDRRIYFLASGRWFSAPDLQGPWTFATASLPADFRRIPANGPRGFVLVSVPGTPQAQEALIQSQIPQKSTLSRADTGLHITYAGAPQFVAIAGTTMAYATNTSFDVIRVGNSYFACVRGAWYVAPSAEGPWAPAADVPEIIYTIPPASPVYPVTYVRVYTVTPAAITYGYTAGYTMGYVSGGVVVYGTGWYYPPYVVPAPVPIYYPRPYSYAGATYYNAATGAWAQGGAIYGPYGGVAKAGTAYNPATGAWARGGAIYGPYGGAGAFSAYNPSTGSYAHGSAAWGPDGASGNASWYNARTGREGSTTQASNAYGRSGSSTIAGPNQTVHTQSQSDARGSAGSFSSSSGAMGAGVKGAGGNSAGVVKGGGGDVYAGADGNVYKKTDSGWQKYTGNGSWSTVQAPARTAGTQASAAPTSRPATARSNAAASASSSGGFENSQLDRDWQSRRAGGEGSRSMEGVQGARGGAREGGGRNFRR